MDFKDHDLAPRSTSPGVVYEEAPLRDPQGRAVEGLHTARITLDNPQQLNSYTTEMVKGVILGVRRASNDRACVAVVLTGAGSKAFCSGGNTAEYATYYAGRPEEYRQYMRLFNDMVSAILHCDRPVICRVNGMRVGGGQEVGMACDFSVAQDLALFGQAGPRHGSAPDGGSTDFLPLFVGIEAAMESATLCQPWSAHKAYRLGMLTRIVPALKVDGAFVPNPLVVTDRFLDAQGRIVLGEPREGAELEAGKKTLARGEIDLALLDREVDALAHALALTMPGCLAKTMESVRKHKLEHWDRNRETNRAWLALNMMTEGKAGFRAFHEGGKRCREADFLLLRRRLAEGRTWGDALIDEVIHEAREAGKDGRG
ncbi:MAG TPA: 6-oxocyclohex-1-ene-1-carbonyl-CoA hydratase [Candidatus Polarisedimenticolia bacterium]|nr:6-oxocyclohex-1-ene-1-carbonyl-CoA hydratase [Candidatus Polarisedimenticolia bacterium]